MKAVILSRKQQTARRWLLEGSQPAAGDAQASSGRLLDALTADIETKIQRELAQNPRTKRDVAEKLDAYVEENLRQSHSCQVCFEVMAPPERTPTMLVPCGHSFCKLCVDTHRGRDAVAASKCPLCRAAIASAAENRALRAIVEDLVGKRRGLEGGGDDGRASLSPRARYAADYASAKLRRSILLREIADARDAAARASGVLDGVALTTAHLEAEKEDVERRLRLLEAERALVDRHLGEQRAKQRDAAEAKAEAEAKARVLATTIGALDAAMAKARALAESLGAEVD